MDCPPRPNRQRSTYPQQAVDGVAHGGKGYCAVTDSDRQGGASKRERPTALKFVIGYKLVKAIVEFALALWLTLAPHQAYSVALSIVHELVEHGALFRRLGEWFGGHLSEHLILDATVITWLDCAATALEGYLLFLGKAWSEWIVIAGLFLLIPFEVLSLLKHPSAGKVIAILINGAIVVYLVRLRLREHHRTRVQAAAG
jgi:uncharacterized membrane protein (DUF2068 family)